LENKRKVTPAGLIHLFVVYFVWGSTYLAIRIGIRSGAGFEPFWFGGMRVFTAGIILLGWGLMSIVNKMDRIREEIKGTMQVKFSRLMTKSPGKFPKGRFNWARR